MYVYVRRIWLGDGRDVRLVSYQRDLGVWMFPGVRRVGFLSAILLNMHAVCNRSLGVAVLQRDIGIDSNQTGGINEIKYRRHQQVIE